MTKNYGRTPTLFLWHYSIKERIIGRGYLLKTHLSNKRGGWNKREGGAKGAKSINVEVGITVEVGFFFFEKSINLEGGFLRGGWIFFKKTP